MLQGSIEVLRSRDSEGSNLVVWKHKRRMFVIETPTNYPKFPLTFFTFPLSVMKSTFEETKKGKLGWKQRDWFGRRRDAKIKQANKIINQMFKREEFTFKLSRLSQFPAISCAPNKQNLKDILQHGLRSVDEWKQAKLFPLEIHDNETLDEGK